MSSQFTQVSFGPKPIRKSVCKAKAQECLDKLWVAEPDEIDLASIAHQAGELVIKDGDLQNAEGRLVAAKNRGGVIRVKSGLNPGRKRFTIAHEIGHYMLHPRHRLDHSDSSKNFTIWNDSSEEAEANFFAAELLMPESLFRPRAQKGTPSLALIDKLALEFSTSSLATAVSYVAHTLEQVALVVSVGATIKWSVRSESFWPMVRSGALHGDSGAGEIVAGKAGNTRGMVRTPAYAWLPSLRRGSERDIREDSRYLDWYDCVVTLLWLEDDLDE
jgi:Zn-dependent peptidase ImmA (M78 family)